ncbi:hypothetical protein D3C80_1085510 [compost metagenome]
MHGKYQIKAVHPDGTPVVEYYGESHPQAGGKLVMPDGYHHDVLSVRHVLKKERNGGQPSYTGFDYVELIVSQ